MPDLTSAEHAGLRERLADLLAPRPVDADTADLQRHLADCRSCRERLSRLRQVHSLLVDADAPPQPSAHLRDRIGAIPLRAQPLWSASRRRGAVGVLGAVAALAAAAVMIVASGPGGDGPPEFREATALAPRASGVEVAVAMGSHEGRDLPMRITASGLTPGEEYSLWLTGERGEVLVETFRPDGVGDCHVVVSAPAGDWTRAIVRAERGSGDDVIADAAI